MRRYVFDCETNGLLDRPDLKVHCTVVQDVDTQDVWRFGPHDLDAAVERLLEADLLIGHNVAGFDVPLIERFSPRFAAERTRALYDTHSAARQMFVTTLLERTAKMRNAVKCRDGCRNGEKFCEECKVAREARFPKRMLNPKGIHKLVTWGYRLGFLKGDYLDLEGVQEEWSPELQAYCERDVLLNTRLFHWLQTAAAVPGSTATPLDAMVVESQVTEILGRQERNGVGFNRAAAIELYAKLAEIRDRLEGELRAEVAPWYWPATGAQRHFIPKRGNKTRGYGAGDPCTKVELMEFNPGSTLHIGDRLQKLYGWKPKEFTSELDRHNRPVPVVDEDTLADLPFPIVPKLIEYLLVKKRIGQIAEGEQAWLKKEVDGVIHGVVMTTGARTSRMSHSKPNLGQVPKVKSPYGKECRACFRPTKLHHGWVMVGADASQIELRMLAHRLALWDGGEYGRVLLEDDPHTSWMQSTGIFNRENQKTWTYATLYGAGDYKRGLVILADWREAYEADVTDKKPPGLSHAENLGRQSKQSLLSNLAALDTLLEELKLRFRQGWLRGLDGRILKIESEHGALNDLLQSDAAVVMKHALVLLDDALRAGQYRHGHDYAYMLNVHDEWQIECRPEHAHEIGKAAVQAIRDAGVKLGVRVPLDGEYKVGKNWQETH